MRIPGSTRIQPPMNSSLQCVSACRLSTCGRVMDSPGGRGGRARQFYLPVPTVAQKFVRASLLDLSLSSILGLFSTEIAEEPGRKRGEGGKRKKSELLCRTLVVVSWSYLGWVVSPPGQCPGVWLFCASVPDQRSVLFSLKNFEPMQHESAWSAKLPPNSLSASRVSSPNERPT